MLPSRLLADTVQLAADNQVLILNSAADPFVPIAAQQLSTGAITLAEDNIANLQAAQTALAQIQRTSTHIALHKYIAHSPPATMDVAVMNLLYQASNAWVAYELQLAAYALKPGRLLYVVGAKDRGVLSVAKRMQELFGNVETLAVSKGHRVLCSIQPQQAGTRHANTKHGAELILFAGGRLDEGTQLLLEALEVRAKDEALDIGCGAGFIGMHIAKLAREGNVTMVDASLAAVDAVRQIVEQDSLANIAVLPSDGAQAVLSQRFDLVVTNPPFHLGGLQTTEVAERFIREAAQVLRPRGRFYLVANRFLKYEPIMRTCFATVEEVRGNTRYKVLRCTHI